jgi:YD repeat-containing protein
LIVNVTRRLSIIHELNELIATNTGNLYVAQTPEVLSYDADGNLTNDGRWSYVWDAENRLIQMTVNTVSICFDGSKLNAAVTDSAQDGGVEFSIFNRDLVSGTINSSEGFENNTGSSVALVMRTWGHPHPLAEVGMQGVALRTSINIWQEARIKISENSGKITYKVMSFDGSGYPSRKLWVDNGFYNNGNPDAQAPQGPISDLWNADPSNPSFVAP